MARREKLAPVIEQFGARVLSDIDEHYTVELVGGSQDIDRFLKRSAQVADVVTLVRSGAMAVHARRRRVQAELAARRSLAGGEPTS